jgi:hypothetical protein
MPSTARFELLLKSSQVENRTTESEPTDSDPEPAWMKSDSPAGPWNEGHTLVGSGFSYTREWQWDDFPPCPNEEDALWTYIYDLDHDSFTVNSKIHFRLSNMPRGFCRYLDEDNDRPGKLTMPPKNLGDEYLSWEPIRKRPGKDEHLLQVYTAAEVKMIEAPAMSNVHLTHRLLFNLQYQLPWSYRREREFKLSWNQATPAGGLMQRFVWMAVRYAIWDGLTFLDTSKHHFDDTAWSSEIERPGIIVMPTEPQYYALVGTNKILISLATDLDIDDVVKMEVAKVINWTAEGSVQVACIISLDAIIIVTVDKSSSQTLVTHTQPLSFENFDGVKALIATLSPLPSHPANRLPNNSSLPVEIVENIFRFLFLTGDRHTIVNFACTCRLFAEIVRHRTVNVGHYVLVNSTTAPGGDFFGLRKDGSVSLYRLEQPSYCGGTNFKVLTDGVDIGYGMLTLKQRQPTA